MSHDASDIELHPQYLSFNNSATSVDRGFICLCLPMRLQRLEFFKLVILDRDTENVCPAG